MKYSLKLAAFLMLASLLVSSIISAQLQFPELILENDGLELDDSYTVSFTDEVIDPNLYVLSAIEDNTGVIVNDLFLDDFYVYDTPLGGERFYANQGFFIEFDDNTALVVAAFQGSTNSYHKFTAYYKLDNGGSWAEVLDATEGSPVAVRADHAHEIDIDAWKFYLLNTTESYLYGADGLVGSELHLTHAPANNYYYYQVGVGTTTVESAYAGSGWANVNGELKQSFAGNTFNTSSVETSGNFDHIFLPYFGQVILRTYIITDAEGNSYTQQMYKVTTSCSGDYDQDGSITSSDLSYLLGDFGCLVGCPTDLSGDGAIFVNDISSFLGSFGTDCD